MIGGRGRLVKYAMMLADAFATGIAFLFGYYVAGVGLQTYFGMKVILPVGDYLWLLTLAIPMWWVLFSIFGNYELLQVHSRRALVANMLKPVVIGALIVGAAVFVSKEKEFARRVVGGFLISNFVLIALSRLATIWLLRRLGRQEKFARNVLLVGWGKSGERLSKSIKKDGWGLRLVGVLADSAETAAVSVLGGMSDIARVLDENVVDDVVVADAPEELEALREIVRRCEEVGVRLHLSADIFDVMLSRAHLEQFDGMQLLTLSAAPYDSVPLAAKRGMDVIIAGFLLLALSWLMGLITIAIKLSSHGPVIFRQRRCGLQGREFTLYKFRSMVAGAESLRRELEERNVMSGPVFKITKDPRVTKVGRLLRRYSLDELPQLWNVLMGDMSLVGPRPPLPEETGKYERWQRRRLSMRPGMTGLWQVGGRHKMDFEEWMKSDLEYIDNWSLWLDLKLLLRTIPAVLSGSGL